MVMVETDVIALEEIDPDRPIMKRVSGRLMVIARAGEKVFAFSNTCPHWGAPMRDGKICAERNEVECPWHRFRYDLTSGESVVSVGGRQPLPVYPARVVDGRVLVSVEKRTAKEETS